MTTKWTVPKLWQGETVAILASGPSMSREQAEMVRGKCRVIAVNNVGIDCDWDGVRQPALAPWADILYAADAKWWFCYQDRALKFAGIKVCIRPNLPWPEVHSLMQSNQRVFDPRPTHLATGGNSGYQAVHVAVHLGVKRMLLCGFDMRDAPKRRRHYYGNHPPKLNSHGSYPVWLRSFGNLAPVLKGMGIEVLNCTPNSALKCFRKLSLQEALNA